MSALRILRLDDVVQKTGLSKNAIYNRMRKGEFPKNFRIGGCAKTVGWLEEDIDEYIRNSSSSCSYKCLEVSEIDSPWHHQNCPLRANP